MRRVKAPAALAQAHQALIAYFQESAHMAGAYLDSLRTGDGTASSEVQAATQKMNDLMMKWWKAIVAEEALFGVKVSLPNFSQKTISPSP